MKTESKPIGKNGVLHVMTDIERRFDEALNKIEITTWPEGFVPVVAQIDEIHERCPNCEGTGLVDSSFVPKGGMAPVWTQKECETCQGSGKIGHRFPREIVKLAQKMEGQSALVIARTLVGLQMGFKP